MIECDMPIHGLSMKWSGEEWDGEAAIMVSDTVRVCWTVCDVFVRCVFLLSL